MGVLPRKSKKNGTATASVSVKFWQGSAFQCGTGFKTYIFLPHEYVRQL
jgi:hypothetical protein